MEIKKSTLYSLVILVLVVGFGFMVFSPDSSAGITGAVVGTGGGDVQLVTLGMSNYNYNPSTIKVKAGQPVSISADSSVSGCFRDLVVRGTNVRKYLRTPQDSVEFTIDKPGVYTFACSMGMGSGQLIVE